MKKTSKYYTFYNIKKQEAAESLLLPVSIDKLFY
jgi:hypothetical protein